MTSTSPYLVGVAGQIEQELVRLEVPDFERRVGAGAAQQTTVGRPRHLVHALHVTAQRRQEPAARERRRHVSIKIHIHLHVRATATEVS